MLERIVLAVSVLALTLITGLVYAGSDMSHELCAGADVDNDQRISACTAVIMDKTEPAENRLASYYNRAGSFENNGDFDRAIADYTSALKIHQEADIYFSRARDWAAKGDLRKAIADDTKPRRSLRGLDP